MSLCPVILAGGGGTRLWPLSREQYPKQFLSLFGRHSLLQETLTRLTGLEQCLPVIHPLVVCNEVHRFLVLEQAATVEIPLRSIMLEPVGRNTAPALTVSAIYLLDTAQDPVMVMMPADHNITDKQKFQEAIATGYTLALKNYLVTFGIRPGHAETGYGYIKCDGKFDTDKPVYRIEGFTEKPAQQLAEKYLTDGNYLWNSGIFMMKASVWCEAIKRFDPDIYAACYTAYKSGNTDNQFFRLQNDAFSACRSDSIDYAVMEKLADEQNSAIAVVELDAGWSDVGAWSAVWELNQHDEHNNAIGGDVLISDTSGCLVKSEYRLVVAHGCTDLVIMETADAVLIADKNKAQDIKEVVELLKAEQREERLLHRRVYRPWGSYETVDAGEHFQVKRLTVYPHRKLSLQSHTQRAEHWVVVRGTATVTRNDEVFELQKNQSTYIPAGTRHRLENVTDELLELIEVQSGDYLGEDDIVRYQDDFGRA